jgi:hypothetical protein
MVGREDDMLNPDMGETPGVVEDRPSKRRIAVSLGLFLLGFILTAAVLHGLVRDPLRLHADIRSEKLLIMDAWQGRAVSSSFGSSHMHDGFDPRAFDAALQGTALATRSINEGVAGGSQSEQRTMALEFVRRLQWPPVRSDGQAPRACFVLLEITAGANFTNDHLVHPRAINIYDWRTAEFIAQLTDASMGWSRRLGRMGYAVAAAGLHYMNMGMVSSKIFPAPMDRVFFLNETEDDRRGLIVDEMTPSVVDHVKEEFAKQPKVSRASMQAVLPGNIELLQELNNASAVRHVQFLYVVMPMLDDLREHPEYPETMAGPEGPEPILNLARPDVYPELYQPKYWHDEAHLNEAGAGVASRLLAEQIKAWYARNPAAARCGG